MKVECWCKLLAQLSLAFLLTELDRGEAVAQEAQPNSALGTNIGAVTERNSSLNDLVSEQVEAGLSWTPVPVFTGGFTVGIVSGDGRGDGTVRLYATHIQTNTIREFTFDKSWMNTSNITVPFYSEGALLLTDGRGDGSEHLYVGEFTFGGNGNTLEFTWDGASWIPLMVGASRQQLIGAAVGDARGDGSPHLYFTTGNAPPNNISYEYTFNGTGFDSVPIATPLAGLSMGTFAIAVADGRNDAVLRLYQGVFDAILGQFHAYELSWNGTAWDASPLNVGSLSQVMGIVVGDGQNDGTNRVYVAVRDFGVREFTYNGSGWDESSDIAIGAEIFSVAFGDGQGDGINRLYTAQYNPGRVTETTFDGATWQTALVADLSGPGVRVIVGDARGDGVKRVYASGGFGVIEFTHQ
jgi:hypothetical protein